MKMEVDIYKSKKNGNIMHITNHDNFNIMQDPKGNTIQICLNDKQMAEVLAELWGYCYHKRNIMKEYNKKLVVEKLK